MKVEKLGDGWEQSGDWLRLEVIPGEYAYVIILPPDEESPDDDDMILAMFFRTNHFVEYESVEAAVEWCERYKETVAKVAKKEDE